MFGDETAGMVFTRMTRALSAARTAAARHDVLAVTHGTAAAIFASRTTGVDAVAFWRSLGALGAIVMDDKRVLQVIQ